MFQDYYNKFFEIFNNFAFRHNKYTVFYDLMKICALSIQNSLLNSPKIEEDYKDTIKKYSKDELSSLTTLFGTLIMMFETREEIADILGSIYNKLGFYNKGLQQFFTPEHIAHFMSEIIIDPSEIKSKIEENGFVTFCEPCSGAGVMILEAASVLKKHEINYQQSLLIEAMDISDICVYMTYIQLSLYGISAIVYCGNTLTQEVKFKLTTPLFHLNYWKFQKFYNTENTIKNEIHLDNQNQNKIYEFKETIKNGNYQISFW